MFYGMQNPPGVKRPHQLGGSLYKSAHAHAGCMMQLETKNVTGRRDKRRVRPNGIYRGTYGGCRPCKGFESIPDRRALMLTPDHLPTQVVASLHPNANHMHVLPACPDRAVHTIGDPLQRTERSMVHCVQPAAQPSLQH